MQFRALFLVVTLALAAAAPASAQVVPVRTGQNAVGASPYATQPTTFTIGDIRVEGASSETVNSFVIRTSGLEAGQEITMPGSEALANAIRSIYELRMFSNVEIAQASTQGQRMDLVIRVQPEPRLANYRFEGIRGRHEDDLQEAVPLLKGSPVRPSDVQRAKQIIADFYKEKGYLRTTVDVQRTENQSGNVVLNFLVDRGEKVEVEGIAFTGNEVLDNGDLRGTMKTKVNRWWRFWKGEKFEEQKFEEDLDRIVTEYNKKGYYDARVLRDSVYLAGEGVRIDIAVEEGPQYHIRNIEWEGNTVYPDRALTNALGLQEGNVFNGKKLEQNLYGNKRSSDVSSLYMDNGYMQFNVQPSIRAVGGDSLDITFDVREGDVYEFGDITIAGNTKTKEHVIRRELYTVPGQTFSKSAIQESIRRLMQLSYFSQESLAKGPGVSMNDQEQTVDLAYDVEEVGSDQLELSGTWGRYGLVLQLGFKFNNFSAQNLFNGSAWRPLPTGDGQKLSLNIRTNGSFFQSYSVSFTEPWFRGRPTPIGGSVSFTRFSRAPFRSRFGGVQQRRREGTFTQISTNAFYEKRLSWPDDRFSLSTQLGYQLYNNEDRLIRSLPEDVSQTVTVRQALTRNSVDNPMFPMSGSKVRLSLELAPPVSDFIQYHKWRFQTDWYVPLSEKITFGVGTDYGYVGSITGETVFFERFDVGGSAFDYGGFNYGTDPVFMRGYPARVISPRRNGEPVGGRILNKYTSELRWMAVQSQQLRAAPYLFMDAANTWTGFDTFNPARLYRSAGIGVRLFLPIVGMIEFNYGYSFDRFTPLENSEDGAPGWRFQFSLGQGFGGR